jgi:hypothetical protein
VTTKRTLIAWASSLACALAACVHAACAGKELLDLGGDAAPGSAGDDGGGSSANGSGAESGTLPCFPSVCSSTEVCCEQYGVVARCVAPGQCTSDLAATCNAVSCPAGSLCCVSVQGDAPPDASYVTGSTRCIQGVSCPLGTLQACGYHVPCPPNYACEGWIASRCVVGHGDAGGAD